MKSKLVPVIDSDIIVYRCGLVDKEQTEPLSYTLHTVKQAVGGIRFPTSMTMEQGKRSRQESGT